MSRELKKVVAQFTPPPIKDINRTDNISILTSDKVLIASRQTFCVESDQIHNCCTKTNS